MHKVRTQYRSANVVMFVFDVTRPDTLDALVPYINDAKVIDFGALIMVWRFFTSSDCKLPFIAWCYLGLGQNLDTF
jgi:hypothetical protein